MITHNFKLPVYHSYSIF